MYRYLFCYKHCKNVLSAIKSAIKLDWNIIRLKIVWNAKLHFCFLWSVITALLKHLNLLILPFNQQGRSFIKTFFWLSWIGQFADMERHLKYQKSVFIWKLFEYNFVYDTLGKLRHTSMFKIILFFLVLIIEKYVFVYFWFTLQCLLNIKIFAQHIRDSAPVKCYPHPRRGVGWPIATDMCRVFTFCRSPQWPFNVVFFFRPWAKMTIVSFDWIDVYYNIASVNKDKERKLN
jgi:hypothetical protein